MKAWLSSRLKIFQSSNPNEVLAQVIDFADSKKACLRRYTSRHPATLRDWMIMDLWSNQDVRNREYLGRVQIFRSRFLFWTTYKAYFYPISHKISS